MNRHCKTPKSDFLEKPVLGLFTASSSSHISVLIFNEFVIKLRGTSCDSPCLIINSPANPSHSATNSQSSPE